MDPRALFLLFSLSISIKPGSSRQNDDVRLVNESNFGETKIGFVQVYLHEAWYPLCAFTWSLADANVTCKQVGYENGAADYRNETSYGNFYFRYNGLHCKGDENSIRECNHTTHAMIDDGTICPNSSAIAICVPNIPKSVNYAAIFGSIFGLLFCGLLIGLAYIAFRWYKSNKEEYRSMIDDMI